MDTPPEFKPKLPEFLLAECDKFQRHMLEQQNVGQQQNEWMIARMIEGDKRFDRIESQAVAHAKSDEEQLSKLSESITKLKTWKLVTVTKKNMVLMVLTVVILPILITVASDFIKAKLSPEPPKPAITQQTKP